MKMPIIKKRSVLPIDRIESAALRQVIKDREAEAKRFREDDDVVKRSEIATKYYEEFGEEVRPDKNFSKWLPHDSSPSNSIAKVKRKLLVNFGKMLAKNEDALLIWMQQVGREKPIDAIKLYIEFAKFYLPFAGQENSGQAITLNVNYDKMSDDQLKSLARGQAIDGELLDESGQAGEKILTQLDGHDRQF